MGQRENGICGMDLRGSVVIIFKVEETWII